MSGKNTTAIENTKKYSCSKSKLSLNIKFWKYLLTLKALADNCIVTTNIEATFRLMVNYYVITLAKILYMHKGKNIKDCKKNNHARYMPQIYVYYYKINF